MLGDADRNVSRALSVVLPVFILLLFVYVFGGAISTDTAYINYVVPGIILLTVGFGAALTATAVNADLTEGLMDRLRSKPIKASAAVTGHVAASMVRNLLVTALVFGVALAIGFRPQAGPWEWVGVIGILSLFVLTITRISVILGLIARSVDAASRIRVLRCVRAVREQRIRPDRDDAGRSQSDRREPARHSDHRNRPRLLFATPVGDSAWLAVAWCAGILVVAVPTAAALFRGRTST